jgi:hypothetical protein
MTDQTTFPAELEATRKAYSCPTYWLAAPPQQEIEFTIGSEVIVMWQCAICGSWHSETPAETGLLETDIASPALVTSQAKVYCCPMTRRLTGVQDIFIDELNDLVAIWWLCADCDVWHLQVIQFAETLRQEKAA